MVASASVKPNRSSVATITCESAGRLSVLARADLLAPNDRRTIEAASVLGQRFALSTLRALADDPRYDGEALLRNALLRSAPDVLQFVHALVRDGIYASLTRSRRRQLHKLRGRRPPRRADAESRHSDLSDDTEAPRAYLAEGWTNALPPKRHA